MENYKSELINKILEQRGHEKSALHYESECIETWIAEARGAYPKLCDYQSEWVKYIKDVNGGGGVGGEEPKPEQPNPEPPIGEFPYETVTTNNTATVNHVVPYAYKSAILKGNTLMNVVSEQSFGGSKTLYESRFYDNIFYTGETFTIFVVNPKVTIIKVGIDNSNTGDWITEKEYNVNNDKRVVYTVPKGDYCCKYVGVVVNTANNASGFENSLVIVSGDKSNLEINKYFEGMQSVQMPVLTTANTNNLIDTNPNSWHVIDGKTQIIQNKPIKVQPNTTYSFFINSSVWGYIFKCDEFGNTSKQYIGNNQGGGTFVTDDDCYYIIARNDLTTNVTKAHTSKMRLFLGTKDLGYTGYVDEVKSNILTTSEDVTLRGIGDVRDELDCLTGEVTQRVGEVVLDGSEAWTIKVSGENTIRYGIRLNDYKPNRNASVVNLRCDKIPAKSNSEWSNDIEMIEGGWSSTEICIRLSKEKANTLDDFKKWLNSNKPIVQYPLATESIKTVDLTVVNQDGEPLSKIKPLEGTMIISTDGTPLKPTVTMEIPVEAITQNLNSFIEGD